MIKISPAVKEIYPDAMFGIMTANMSNATASRSQMDTLKKVEIDRIKTKYKEYDRKVIINSEPICHYVTHYKKFKKTYPVLLQLESILLKDKGIPSVGISVEAMFLAEVKNLLLTGGHDLDQIGGYLSLDIAVGGENYLSISGKQQQLTKGDLYLSDDRGILSSVLNGPDYRTRITDTTQNVLYFVYGVNGITGEQIRKHLENIRYYLLTASPNVNIQTVEVF
jgi:DNA/RNA-binding domain of Phe-tRNA-synthetase-like protein